MEIQSIQYIWDSYYGRDRMRVRTTHQDEQGNQTQTVQYYYYSVYDRRAQHHEQEIKPSMIDLRA